MSFTGGVQEFSDCPPPVTHVPLVAIGLYMDPTYRVKVIIFQMREAKEAELPARGHTVRPTACPGSEPGIEPREEC